MNDERLIQILAAQQWEKCKGELRALIELLGSTYPKYEGNKVIEKRCWRDFQLEANKFIDEVESHEYHLGGY